MEKSYGLHWFRRDLRVAGNIALKYNWKKFDGKVVGIFCFDKKFLSRPDMSYNRFQFFINTLVALKSELQSIGSDLLVMDTSPEESFKKLIKDMDNNKIKRPSLITWGRDYEPFSKNRDNRLSKLFMGLDIETYNHRDHLLIEPFELHKNHSTQDGYQVYSPFAKKWLKLLNEKVIQKRLLQQNKGIEYLEGLSNEKYPKAFNLTWPNLFNGKINYPETLQKYSLENNKKVTIDIPEAGSVAAFSTLKNFSKNINNYGKQRDFPNLKGTSKLSMYLKNGSITVPQIIRYLNLKSYVKKESGRDIFLSELIWREFYYHILSRHPRVEKESFLTKYKDIEWQNKESYFNAWKEGKTGFPIVDAGMRELKQTGWMHNRVRMIVASFLTKDLLIDWKWGEKYFMECLLDGDLAPNNGGWQWAASTGCDPQPYFRIFNPWLQGQRFDKEGIYIKKFIPELRSLNSKSLHEPIVGHTKYPEPIVDHKVQRELALSMYKKVRKT